MLLRSHGFAAETARHPWRPHSRPIAPSRASLRKNTEKIVEKVVENGGKWRFFEGPKRHFAVLRADYARLQRARLPDFTFTESGWLARHLARHTGSGAPFYALRGNETTYV